MKTDSQLASRKPSLKLLWVLAVPAYLADQATKMAIVKKIAVHEDVIEVIPGFFWIHHIMNTGVAFGMANGAAHSNVIFGGIAMVTCGAILILWRKGFFPSLISRIAAALLIAGALGNLTDRIRLSYVVDWISVNLKFMLWPSFNLADAYICIAAGLMILSSFHGEETPQKKKSS